MSLLRRLLPRTILQRNILTLTLSAAVFLVITVAAVLFFCGLPSAERSADDLSALMVSAARNWARQPVQEWENFDRRLYEESRLWLTAADTPIEEAPQGSNYWPYVALLTRALEKDVGGPVPVVPQRIEGRLWYWADLLVGQQKIRVGFPEDRIPSRPFLGLLVLLLASAVLVLLTSIVMARRISRPLTLLADATARIGKGQIPPPLPETGAAELASLTAQFNQLATQVRELVANRTTLLAGMSHDLRTPIARMRLLLEMLPDDENSGLVVRMKDNLEQMNRLIEDSLEFARNLEPGERERLDIRELLNEIAATLIADNHQVDWRSPEQACVREVNVIALRRVTLNLLENALRYGGGADPVAIELECGGGTGVVVRVLDRGPGIPDDHKEAVFRPFHRLDQSRSSETGGSGLGLAIARQLAEANEMQIQLSDREGGGTVARVIIDSGSLDGSRSGT